MWQLIVVLCMLPHLIMAVIVLRHAIVEVPVIVDAHVMEGDSNDLIF